MHYWGILILTLREFGSICFHLANHRDKRQIVQTSRYLTGNSPVVHMKGMNLKAALSFLAIFWLHFLVFAQQDQITVTGRVIGEDSPDGLPGVTVQIKGTSKGVISDIDGNYQISTAPDDVLIYSFMGYHSIEQSVNNRNVINVTLPLDVKGLEEVVIVGYGEQKKANLTGAVTSIDTKDLDEIPTGNLAMGLVGKMAGVQVNRNGTGIPGTNTPLIIRNESASSLQRQVLYVIDGVIYSDNDFHAVPGPSGSEVFNRLDPSEIESISILKDGAAAVYGARAAGGVVIVKTKRGQIGKPKFSYNGSAGIGQPTNIPDMLTGEQHAELWNALLDVQKNDLNQRVNPDLYFDDEELAEIRTRNYDWLDGLYKAAYNQRHALSISGGTDQARYFLSGTFYNETGNYDKLWYKRYSLRSNMEYDIKEDFTFGLGINYSVGNRKNPNYDPEGTSVNEGVLRDWYKRPLTAAKWIPPTVDGLPVNNGAWNPYGLQQSENYRTSSSDNINLSARLDYKAPFLEGLSFKGLLSYNINSSYDTRFGQDYEVYNFYNPQDGVYEGNLSSVLIPNSEGLRESYSRGNMYQINVSSMYNTQIGKHNLSAMLVYEQQEGNTRGFWASKENANIDGFDYFWAFTDATNNVDGIYNISGRWSVIGRLNYDYDGKYLFESSFRSEASNKFAPEYRFGIFPAFSLGWVVSEESFFKDNIDFIDFFKVRSSIGITGNDGNSAPSEWKPTFISGSSGPIFGTGNGVLSNTLEARNNGFYVPSRTWAKTRNFNVGGDLSAFGNKLEITGEYYYVLIYDAFDRMQNIPFLVGNPKPPFENYKESFSRGFELQTEYSDAINQDIKFSVYANFTKRKSRPLKLYQNPSVLGTWEDQLLNDDSNQPGYFAMGIIKDDAHLQEVLEMYPNQPKIFFNGDSVPALGNIPIAPGMIYYKDVGGPNRSRVPDGKIDGNDRGIIAEYTTAPYNYGFGFSFNYKRWRLNAAFGGAFGHKVFIEKDEQVVNTVSDLVITQSQNTFSWWNDYWSPENTDAALPRPYEYGFAGETSTFWMRDGHTLRLNNVSLSYNMPDNIASRLRMSNFKVYASATNLWTIISPFDFKDPAVSRAFDYPLVRMINMGLSFSI
mgnify:CR=1 FL=1